MLPHTVILHCFTGALAITPDVTKDPLEHDPSAPDVYPAPQAPRGIAGKSNSGCIQLCSSSL